MIFYTRRWPGFIVLALLVTAAVCSSPAAAGEGAALLELDSLHLPAGFEISLFASNVPGVRSLVLSPGGTVFAGTLSEGKVYALRDLNGDARADEVLVVDDHLLLPSGVAFRSGDLYVAEGGRILIYAGIEERLYDPPEPIVMSNAFPADTFRGWHSIAFGPDGKLYATIGAPCNVCEPDDPRFATIARMGRNGENFEIVARGVRSAGALAWHPVGGELYFTDTGREWLGDDFPRDELNRVSRDDLHFGFPYCHGEGLSDPEFGGGRECGGFTPPVALLGAHVGAFGLCFPREANLPAPYRNSAFIAERGSLVGSAPAGFRVTTVFFPEEGDPVYKEFAGGWLKDGEILGRPTDVVVTPDGDLLVSDEYGGVIYRIRYDWSSTAGHE